MSFPAAYLLVPALMLGGSPMLVDMPLFVVAGATGFLLWFLLTQAYARAPAQSLAAAEYTGLIWSALLGYFFFAEVPRWQVWIGAGVIIAAVMLSAWDSRRKPRKSYRRRTDRGSICPERQTHPDSPATRIGECS